MADEIEIAELEAAAQILYSSPNVVTSEQRCHAENVFLNFLKTKSLFQLCQNILENSKSDYLQFQVASLLKQAVISEWSQQEKSMMENVRRGLMNFVTQNPNLQSCVREQLLLVVAIIVKRVTVDECDRGDEQNIIVQILTEVSQLVSSGDNARQIIGCSILTALLYEFSATIRASDVGLTWSCHFKAKSEFEKWGLKQIFQFCFERLSELFELGTPVPPDVTKLFEKFLIIAEQVLTWNFWPVTHFHRRPVEPSSICWIEAHPYPTLKPGIEWADVFMDPNVSTLFFKLHWQVRDVPDLCNHTLQCLDQLASIYGPVGDAKDDRFKYLSWFVENTLRLLSSGPIKDYEAVGVANFIWQLQDSFSAVYIASLPTGMLQAYVVVLRNLAFYFCECATKEEVLGKEDHEFAEAFDKILKTWRIILENSKHYPADLIKPSCLQIFNEHFQSDLHPIDVAYRVLKNHRDEIDEVDGKGCTKYPDQLETIGIFGRKIMEHSIPLLVRLLESRVTHLQVELQKIDQQAPTAENFAALKRLNEDIEMLVLTSGHVLIDDYDRIPQEVIHYCNSESANINIDTTLQVLTSPGHMTSDIPGAEQTTDPVIRLIAAVFRLCEVEQRALEANFAHVLSPQVAMALMWFIRRFSVCYLLIKKNVNTELSLSLAQAFGSNSEAAMWILHFLIDKVVSNFLHWTSEPQVLTDSSRTLVVMVNNLESEGKSFICSSFIRFVNHQNEGAFEKLPSAAKQSVFKSLLLGGLANPDDESRDGYCYKLLKPLQDHFHAVVCQNSFSQIQVTQSSQMFHQKKAETEVLDLLECLIGIINGCKVVSLSPIPYIHTMLKESAKFVDVFHNYRDIVTLVFQAFRAFAKMPLLCSPDHVDSKKLFFECCMNMIKSYAKHNIGNTIRQANEENEDYQDLSAFIQLLDDILSISFRDGSFLYSVNKNDEEEKYHFEDVVAYGLDIMMSIINTELLQYPNVCEPYFKLIVFMCRACTSKICSLPTLAFHGLMSSVEWGLSHFSPKIAALSFDFLSTFADRLHKAEMHGTPMYDTLKRYLRVVLHLLIFEPLDPDLTQKASDAVFNLICTFEDIYPDTVQGLINTQTDPATINQLTKAFTNLTEGVVLHLNRHCQFNFREKFDCFISEIRGISLK